MPHQFPWPLLFGQLLFQLRQRPPHLPGALADIDNILAIPAPFHYHFVDHAKQVRGQLGHAFGTRIRKLCYLPYLFE